MFVVFQQLLPGDAEYDEKKSNKFPKTPNPYRARVYIKPSISYTFFDSIKECIDYLKEQEESDQKHYKPVLESDTGLYIDEKNPINSYYISHHKAYRTQSRSQSMGFASLVWAGRDYPEKNEKFFIKQFPDATELLDIRKRIIERIKDITDRKGYVLIESRHDCSFEVPNYDFDHFPVEIELHKKDEKYRISLAKIFVFYHDKEFNTPCVKLDMGGQIPLLPKEIAGYSTTWYENLPSKRKNYLANEANINKLAEILEKKL